MPLGGDTVHYRVAQHRAAVSLYDVCVDAENDNEGSISNEDFERLQQATSKAFNDMMFFARCLIIDIPTTRTGLLKWTRYMRKLLVDWRGTNSGSPYLPDKIGDEPWINTFFKILTDRLSKMGDAGLQTRKPRRTNSEAMARKREFNEAMRQRIRQLATERDLPDDEIKSVLRLKHQEIGAFAIRHSVSLAWLLEGAGPVFKKYPPGA
jgi:hypothetical protein